MHCPSSSRETERSVAPWCMTIMHAPLTLDPWTLSFKMGVFLSIHLVVEPRLGLSLDPQCSEIFWIISTNVTTKYRMTLSVAFQKRPVGKLYLVLRQVHV